MLRRIAGLVTSRSFLDAPKHLIGQQSPCFKIPGVPSSSVTRSITSCAQLLLIRQTAPCCISTSQLLFANAPFSILRCAVGPSTPVPTTTQTRTITKFSLSKGKRATVKTVLKRFYRLDWGIWIRRKAGWKKKLWKKSERSKYKLRQHVFCNATQSKLLDKMVSKYWKRRHYYVDDPYEPYHSREEFWITRKQPR